MSRLYFLFFSFLFVGQVSIASSAEERFEKSLQLSFESASLPSVKMKLSPEAFSSLTDWAIAQLSDRKSKQLDGEDVQKKEVDPEIRKLLNELKQKPVPEFGFPLINPLFTLKKASVSLQIDLKNKKAVNSKPIEGLALRRKSNSLHVAHIPMVQLSNEISIVNARNAFYVVFSGEPSYMYHLKNAFLSGIENSKKVSEACVVEEVNPIISHAKFAAQKTVSSKRALVRNSNEMIAENLLILLDQKAFDSFLKNPTDKNITRLIAPSFAGKIDAVLQAVLYTRIIDDKN